MVKEYCPCLYHLQVENKPNELEPRCELSDEVLSGDCLITVAPNCKTIMTDMRISIIKILESLSFSYSMLIIRFK